MNSFLLDSFKGGISDWEDKGIPGSFKFGSNLDIRRKRDTLYSNDSLTDLLLPGTFDDRVLVVVVSADGNSYWFLRNGKIWKQHGVTFTLMYTDAEATCTGATEWVNSAGDTFLYWTTTTKLHRKRLIGTGYTNANWSDVDALVNGQTYPKTNLTSASAHTMRIINGALLGVNANTLFLVGYDDSYTNNALQLIPGNVGKTLIEDGIYARVGANRVDSTEQSFIYTWDGISQNYNDKIQLAFPAINAIVNAEVIIAQYGTNGELYFFGDATKLPVVAFPGGGQVDVEGVDVDEGMALFGVYNNGAGKTGIYSYGRKRKNADFALNLEHQFDCDEINVVKKIGSIIYFAYKLGSSYGIKWVDSSTRATKAIYQSVDLKSPPQFELPTTYTAVALNMTPLPAGCSVEVWRRLDKVSTGGTDYLGHATTANDGWYQCTTEDLSGGVKKGSFNDTGGTYAVFQIGEHANSIEIQIILNCSGNLSPEVFRALINFQ